MMKSQREDFACFFCDYWWLFLTILAILLSLVFTRNLWLPLVFPGAASLPVPISPPSLPSSDLPFSTVLAPTQLGTGDVQVTLRWSGPNDLDLHVIDPGGEEIYFQQPTSSSHGQLDVDANRGCNSRMDNPVENIFWPVGQAPTGKFQVEITYYANCDPATVSTPFTVEVLIDGKQQTFQGQVESIDQTVQIYSYTR